MVSTSACSQAAENLVLPSTEQHGRTIGSSPVIWISHSLWVIKTKRSRSFVSASIQLITNIFLAFEERWQTLFLLESMGFFLLVTSPLNVCPRKKNWGFVSCSTVELYDGTLLMSYV